MGRVQVSERGHDLTGLMREAVDAGSLLATLGVMGLAVSVLAIAAGVIITPIAVFAWAVSAAGRVIARVCHRR